MKLEQNLEYRITLCITSNNELGTSLIYIYLERYMDGIEFYNMLTHVKDVSKVKQASVMC